jgi:hypothetical protein
MQLLEEERFALTFTLNESSINMDALLINADVTERNRTGVGFFTTVKLQYSIPVRVNDLTYWERNFEHKDMLYGGCFMVRLIGSNVLEIEAVAFESHWPEQFRKDDFIY